MIIISLINILYAHSSLLKLQTGVLLVSTLLFTTQRPIAEFNDNLNANIPMEILVHPSEIEHSEGDTSKFLEHHNITGIIKLFPNVYLFIQEEGIQKKIFFHQKHDTDLIAYLRHIFEQSDTSCIKMNPIEGLHLTINQNVDTPSSYFYTIEIQFNNTHARSVVSSHEEIICGLDQALQQEEQAPVSSSPCCKITPSNTCCITDEKKKKNKK